jgi:hypothetical protein
MRLAHIVYWEGEHGPVPEGLELDHLCRNPPCVNPAHLEPVTHQQNMQRSARTFLTPDQVRAIRESNEPGPVLAARYGVTRTAIHNVRQGKTWANLD